MRSALLVLLAMATALIGAAWVVYRHDIIRSNARLENRSQIATTRFGPVEYATLGQGRPVLAIHGSGGGFDQALDFMAPLAAGGFRLVAPSRFGYLRTPARADQTIEMQADAFADLLDTLDIRQAIVVGGSAGALSALQFAIRHPQRCAALVLLVPASYAPDRRPNESGAQSRLAETLMMTALRSDMIFWGAIRLAPDLMTRLILATEPRLVHAASTREQARVGDVLARILPVSRRADGLLFDSRTAGDPPPMALGAITCPTLVISAEDDLYGTAASARHAAAAIPSARLLVLPDGGHLFVGHHDQVWQAVTAFLDEVAPD